MQAAKLLALGLAATAAAASSSSSSSSSSPEFDAWAKQHDRAYGSADERALRAAVFAQNKRFVEAHNAAQARGLKSFTTKLNQFADLTNAEYRATVLGLRRAGPAAAGAAATFDARAAPTPPDAFDARPLGIVNGVKNRTSSSFCVCCVVCVVIVYYRVLGYYRRWILFSCGLRRGRHCRKTRKTDEQEKKKNPTHNKHHRN
jgi:hypothetical protein